ncbi:hypothetical protein WJX84_000647 [Apatococcus fuscideae]|uniref:Uncharacterized protein n=1 Tax=Apatococcus fuscideae TaxID=2026836 RepID=A0AAW1T3I5_9CHLO
MWGAGHSFSAAVVPDLVESQVLVSNARGVLACSLAEWALFACGYFAKDLPRMLAQQQAAKWEKYNVEEHRGKKMGIIAMRREAVFINIGQGMHCGRGLPSHQQACLIFYNSSGPFERLEVDCNKHETQRSEITSRLHKSLSDTSKRQVGNRGFEFGPQFFVSGDESELALVPESLSWH